VDLTVVHMCLGSVADVAKFIGLEVLQLAGAFLVYPVFQVSLSTATGVMNAANYVTVSHPYRHGPPCANVFGVCSSFCCIVSMSLAHGLEWYQSSGHSRFLLSYEYFQQLSRWSGVTCCDILL